MKTKSLFIGASLLLTACATTPVPTAEAVAVPAERVVDQRWAAPMPGTGRVVLKRDLGYYGSGCFAHVFVDGVLAVQIAPGEKVNMWLPAGERLLSVKLDGRALCAINHGLVEAQVAVSPGAVRTMRISIGEAENLALQPTAF